MKTRNKIMSDESSPSESWRVKLYHLDDDGNWKEIGTGFLRRVISGSVTHLVLEDETDGSLLLKSKITLNETYDRQNDNIILWNEVLEEGELGVALSFQEVAGCQHTWQFIQEMISTERNSLTLYSTSDDYMSDNSDNYLSYHTKQDSYGFSSTTLPTLTMTNLDDISSQLNTMNSNMRQHLAHFVLKNDAKYLMNLMDFSTEVENDGDLKLLAKVSDVWKGICYLNDVTLLNFILKEDIFLRIAGALEYDKALSHKGNYREFLTMKSKFIQVGSRVIEPLKEQSSKLFRIKYLKEYMLRPSIDEIGSLALNTLINDLSENICNQCFTDTILMKDVLTGLLSTPEEEENHKKNTQQQGDQDQKVVRNHDSTISKEGEDNSSGMNIIIETSSTYIPSKTNGDDNKVEEEEEEKKDISSINNDDNRNSSSSILSESMKCLYFLRELFYLSRQLTLEKRSEFYKPFLEQFKTLFFSTLCMKLYQSIESTTTATTITNNTCNSNSSSSSSNNNHNKETQQLQLYDPTVMLYISEIIVSVAIVEPHYLRSYILEDKSPINATTSSNTTTTTTATTTATTTTTATAKVITKSHHPSLLFILIKTLIEGYDSAVIDQLGDTIKMLLDCEHMEKSEKNKFLNLFYDHYINYLMTPFLDPHKPYEVCTITPMNGNGNKSKDINNHTNMKSAISTSSSSSSSSSSNSIKQDTITLITSRRVIFDIMCQCVIQHSYRMKYYIMRMGILTKCLTVLDSTNRHLHLSAIKFIRTILSVKDEFYVRHIVKYDILKPLFKLFTKIAKYDNLIVSLLLEIIQLIRTENMESLIKYIVENYENSFEQLNHDTYTQLKVKYDQIISREHDTLHDLLSADSSHHHDDDATNTNASTTTSIGKRSHSHSSSTSISSVKRRIRNAKLNEREAEDAYLEDDDDDNEEDDDEGEDDENTYGPVEATAIVPLSPIAARGKGIGNQRADRKYGSYEESSDVHVHAGKDNKKIRKMSRKKAKRMSLNAVKSIQEEDISDLDDLLEEVEEQKELEERLEKEEDEEMKEQLEEEMRDDEDETKTENVGLNIDSSSATLSPTSSSSSSSSVKRHSSGSSGSGHHHDIHAHDSLLASPSISSNLTYSHPISSNLNPLSLISDIYSENDYNHAATPNLMTTTISHLNNHHPPTPPSSLIQKLSPHPIKIPSPLSTPSSSSSSTPSSTSTSSSPPPPPLLPLLPRSPQSISPPLSPLKSKYLTDDEDGDITHFFKHKTSSSSTSLANREIKFKFDSSHNKDHNTSDNESSTTSSLPSSQPQPSPHKTSFTTTPTPPPPPPTTASSTNGGISFTMTKKRKI